MKTKAHLLGYKKAAPAYGMLRPSDVKKTVFRIFDTKNKKARLGTADGPG